MIQNRGASKNGKMLWFNEAKGHGYIETDDGERLPVDREGFIGGAAPVGRCGQLLVTLTVGERAGQRIAVDVSLVADDHPRRARRRSSTRSSQS